MADQPAGITAEELAEIFEVEEGEDSVGDSVSYVGERYELSGHLSMFLDGEFNLTKLAAAINKKLAEKGGVRTKSTP